MLQQENDNNDLKFVSRFRFKIDDFLDELFISIFDYCSVSDLGRFGWCQNLGIE
jgi:hypothetical protein